MRFLPQRRRRFRRKRRSRQSSREGAALHSPKWWCDAFSKCGCFLQKFVLLYKSIWC